MGLGSFGSRRRAYGAIRASNGHPWALQCLAANLSGADLGEWERGPDGYARRKAL